MTERIEGPRALLAGGFAANTLQTKPLSFTEGIVTQIDVIVPPGPSGLVGFYIAHSGTQVIPYEVGQFIIVDDVHMLWPIGGLPTGEKWTLVGYNNDIYPHTIQTIFHIDEFGAATVDTTTAVPIG